MTTESKRAREASAEALDLADHVAWSVVVDKHEVAPRCRCIGSALLAESRGRWADVRPHDQLTRQRLVTAAATVAEAREAATVVAMLAEDMNPCHGAWATFLPDCHRAVQIIVDEYDLCVTNGYKQT